MRWRRASRPQRRAADPGVVGGKRGARRSGGVDRGRPIWVRDRRPVGRVPYYAFATVPVAVLFVFLQRRLARGAVATLVVGLGEPSAGPGLREALARALGTRRWRSRTGSRRRAATLTATAARSSCPMRAQIGFPLWSSETASRSLRWCTTRRCNTTRARRVGLCRGRIDARERTPAGGAACGLAELRASRTRLVEATEAERRRIERDLHDGTQQRLVSIAMSLGLLESKLPTDPEQVVPIVRETRAALAGRPRGAARADPGYPPDDPGRAWFAGRAGRALPPFAAPGPVAAGARGAPARPVESAAYFVVSEALTNAAKHSHASEVRVTGARR